MPIQEVVPIIRSYLEDDGATLEQRHGPQAVMAAQGLAALLKARLEEETAYVSLWDQLEAEPQQTATKLAGALEALVEADPALARRMEAFMEEYRRATPRTVFEQRTSEERGTDTAPRGGSTYRPVDTPGDYTKAGTYLYGNLHPGITSQSKVSEEELRAEGNAEAAAVDVSQVVSLFQELHALVEGYEGPSPAIKRSLQAELERVAKDVVEEGGNGEYEESIINHLGAIERLSPHIYQLVIEKLAGPEADFAPVVQRVARRMLTID